jgi:hypothetical protein
LGLTKEHQYHARTKHIDICFHFIRWIIEDSKLQLIYCPTEEMVADILTKALVSTKVKHFARELGLVPLWGGDDGMYKGQTESVWKLVACLWYQPESLGRRVSRRNTWQVTWLLVLRRSVGSVNSEGFNGIDEPVPRMQDAPGVFEFFLSPFTLQFLAKYGLIIMIFISWTYVYLLRSVDTLIINPCCLVFGTLFNY